MLIVLNNKMNLNILEIKKYEKKLRDYDVIVMPQMQYLSLFTNGQYILGSQSLYIDNITGGSSSESLRSMDVEYALVGHSDQRKLLNETELTLAKKIDEAAFHKIKPILCIGDTLEEKALNKGIKVIEKELNKILSNIVTSVNNIIIAYEPKWDTSKNLSNNIEYIDKVLFFIKSYIKDNYGFNVKVLYDGVVNTKNIKELLNLNIVDGFILEDSSADIYEVINIYETING